MGSTLILTLLIIHILLPILSQHHIQPIVSACNKGDKLKDHQQLTFEFFSRICVLILPPPPSFFLKRQRFQNFVKFFDHIKCKNTKSFFAISNSSPFNFTPSRTSFYLEPLLSWNWNDIYKNFLCPKINLEEVEVD